jgi:N-acetylneuraminic acid mutarotase
MSRRTSLVLFAAAAVVVSVAAPMAAMASAGPSPAAADLGVWTVDQPSGLPRQEITFVTVGSKAYLAGGRSNVQQVFDLVNHTWSTVAPLPEALDHIGAVALNGLVYYIGGLNGYPNGASYGNVYTYDPATNVVRSVAPMPAGRDRGAAGVAVYQGQIYVAGGYHNLASVGYFDRYDPATDTWTSLPDMPDHRDHVAAAVVGNRLYVIGGRDHGVGPQSTNDAFDFTTGKWVTGLAPLPTARAGSAAAVFGNQIMVIGGEIVGATFANNEAYDTVTNTWSVLASMPTARHGIQAAMYDGAAHIADGGTKSGGGGATDIQEVFSFSGAAATGRPDCRVRLLSESKLLGNNVYNTAGTGQTRAITTSAATTTFVLSLQNDNTLADALTLVAPGSFPGFSVRYLAGLSGTTDITAKVLAGTYRTVSLAPAATRAVRLEVTVAPGTASGTSMTWLGNVGSNSLPSSQDSCGGQVTVG